MIDAGADVNTRDKDNNTALILASMGGHLKCVEALIKEEADVNETGKDTQTALHRTAEGGHVRMVVSLIEAGADVNKQDVHKRTALIRATENDHGACVESLIGAGTDVNIFDMEQCTALNIAARQGYYTCVDHLVRAGANTSVRGTDENTPLEAAAKNGHGKCLRLLIQGGADVNVDDGRALIDAVHEDNFNCVAHLLKAGTRKNSGELNRIALLVAAKKGHYRCLKLLLDSGVREDIQDYLSSPLRFAVKLGREECAKLLIEAEGVCWGTTALLQEASFNQCKNVCFLLHIGVAINHEVSTCFIEESMYGVCDQIFKLLFAAGQKVEEELFDLFSFSYETSISLMRFCREVTRKHLLQMSKINLFFRVKKLGLPPLLEKYLVYNVTLNYIDQPVNEKQQNTDYWATRPRRSFKKYFAPNYVDLPSGGESTSE